MSGYENYTETSRSYDTTREAVGVEIILGCLLQTDIPLGAQRVLDAGCGTGNYTRALIRHVDRIDAVDLNPGMLARAQVKLASEAKAARVHFHVQPIDRLPFPDASLDGAMLNQVLHHLPDAPDQGFPRHREVLAEVARVLRPGGALIINICSREQLQRGFWPYHLVPKALEDMVLRHVPLDRLIQMLTETGFRFRQRFVPLDAVLQSEAFFDPRGPLNKSWRDGDSIWRLPDAATLEAVCSKILLLDERGQLEKYVRTHDAARPTVGQTTFLFAQRT